MVGVGLLSDIENLRNKYRSKIEIVRDILQVVADRSSRKTRIMYGANLSYRLLTRYLDDIMRAGMMECDETEYMITKRGERFLRFYESYEKDRAEIEEQVERLKNGGQILEKMLNNDDGKIPRKI